MTHEKILGGRRKFFGFLLLETWAHGAPLLTLDQLWLSHDLSCADLKKYPGLASDHSRVVFTVSAVRR